MSQFGLMFFPDPVAGLRELRRKRIWWNASPADTLVGVAALSRPEYLIEVDAIAIVENATETDGSRSGSRRSLPR